MATTNPQITSVLVANRGEIARRVFATCRRRGLATVAVFSDADANAPFVHEADAAVRLPGNAPAETYLRGDLIIDAARRAGADAIHPGYGFLSENAEFAQAVLDAGLAWIGPPPSAITSMGSKVESKAMMAAAGVPVLTRLEREAITEADLPVLIKASAGGGGRGMRIVRDLADLDSEMANAAREAGSAFGDATVFVERYIETGRHVEVQVMADAHGTVWALGERECSIQRRHQKVIEEAPSPVVDMVGGTMRDDLLTAARAAAGAVGYVGAGTVEFLANDRGEFWFLEMNTRLQVEHPVTENVTGLDLVNLQLDMAEGHRLDGSEPSLRGHSIEARLYAEDPMDDYAPQIGIIDRFEVPGVSAEFEVLDTVGLRLDSGIEDGGEVGTHYDAMVAKVITWAPTREEAASHLAQALERTQLHGLRSNRELLVGILTDTDFLSGRFDTGFLSSEKVAALSAGASQVAAPGVFHLAAAVADAALARQGSALGADLPSGWRNVVSAVQTRSYTTSAGEQVDVGYRLGRAGLEVADGLLPEGSAVQLIEATPQRVRLEVDGVIRAFTISRYGTTSDAGDAGGVRIFVDAPSGSVALEEVPRYVDPASVVAAGALVAPMPGAVIRVAVEPGDHVVAGQPLLWLEAMKMEHQISANVDGIVAEVRVTVGQQVEPGEVIVVVDDGEQEDQPTGGTDE